MGTGTEELANQCIEKGLKKTEFIQDGDFRTVLYRPVSEENQQASIHVNNLGNYPFESAKKVIHIFDSGLSTSPTHTRAVG